MIEFKVKIENYKPINKGSLRGFFTAVLDNPPMKIHKCREFAKGDNVWCQGPTERVEGKNGEEDKYYPYIYFTNPEYKISLETAILHALKEFHGTSESGSKEGKKSSLQTESPIDWI